MTELLTERIVTNLARLRLSKISELLPQMIESSQDKALSNAAFLDLLLEEEVAAKEQRRVETALKISGLPFIKTIDEFDFTFQPSLDRKLINTIFDLSFLTRHDNIILAGPPGVGKTHLAVALSVKACQSGMGIYFTTMSDLIAKLEQDHQSGKKGKARSHYKAALVIVDEVGYTPITREQCHLFYQFVAIRYERASTIITTNKTFSEWEELFHDPMIVTAILDRLLHHSIAITIRGNSYRLKEKMKEK